MPKRGDRSPKSYSLIDMRGSRDVLAAMRPQVRSWTTPEQLPAVLDMLERCCGSEDDKMLRDYADYVTRLDRDASVEGRRVGDWIDEARRHNPRLGKLLDRRR